MKKIIPLVVTTLSVMTLASCGYTENVIQNHQALAAAKNNVIAVNISNGTAMSPQSNTAQTYQPINLQIHEGKCNKTNIALSNNETVLLKSCYIGNVLFLDTEKAKWQRSNQGIRFNFNPVWQQGFVYQNITTNGRAHLNNVNVKVQLLNNQ